MFRNRTLEEKIVIIAYEILGVIIGVGLIVGVIIGCLAG